MLSFGFTCAFTARVVARLINTENMKTVLIIIISVFAISCASQKQTNKRMSDFNEIRFGSNGGFTGFGEQYLIKNDGNTFTVNNDSLTLLNKLSRRNIKNINKQLVEIAFENKEFNEIGNMTYFIEVITPKYENNVTWTDQSQADNLKELYVTLVNTLKKQ